MRALDEDRCITR